MKIRIIFLFLLISGISFSCKKDDTVTPGEIYIPLIRKVNVADQPYIEFQYNESNLISEEKSKFNLMNYHYNVKDQLVSVDYYSNEDLLSNEMVVLQNALNLKGLMSFVDADKGSTVKYEYSDNGQLVKTTVSRQPGSGSEYSEYSVYSYDLNFRLGKQTIYWENKISGYIDYLYDTRGNLTKETLYSVASSGEAELSTTTQYEFDNQKNPFITFHRLMTPGINTNTNNIIKETLTIHFKPGQGTNIVQVTLNSYTYNSRGYPVRKNSTVEYLYE